MERLVAGVCGGLLVALMALLFLSGAGVAVEQSGPSPGKWLFFGLWAAATAVALWLPKPRRTVGIYLCTAAAFALLAVATSHWRVGLAEAYRGPAAVINIGLVLLAALLAIAGGALLAPRRRR